MLTASTRSRQRAWLDAFVLSHGVTKTSDPASWYALQERCASAKEGSVRSLRQLIRAETSGLGRRLLAAHKGSLVGLLRATYPGVSWQPQRLLGVPRGHLRSLEEQRAFLDDVAKRRGHDVGDMAQWYGLTQREFIALGGGGLLARYGNSLPRLLRAVYAELSWDEMQFIKAPQGYWSDVAHQRRFVDELGRSLGFGEGQRELWYGVPNKLVIEHGGSRLLAVYKGSLSALLAVVYNDFQWDPLRFSKGSTKTYWISNDNQTKFMFELARKLLIDPTLDTPSEMEKWYSVSKQSLIALGARSLLAFHNFSVPQLLATIFPDFKWEVWRFPGRTLRARRIRSDNSPPGRGDAVNLEAVFQILDSSGNRLGIASTADWMRLKRSDLAGLGLTRYKLEQLGGLPEILKQWRPVDKDDIDKFIAAGRQEQR